MQIPKSEAEYNMKSLRFLLLTITTMFIFVAVLMIVLGISVYSRYHDFSFLYESAKNGRFFTPSIMVVLLGIVMLVVTSFGFFGSLKQSTCMVNTYALVLFFTLILELVIVVVAFTMDPAHIIDSINIPIDLYTTDIEVEMEIDVLQASMNCCGSISYADYIGRVFNDNHSTVNYIQEEQERNIVLPQSCCLYSQGDLCITVRSTGCSSALVNMVLQNASVIGVLGVSVLFIQLLGIIFALLLARAIRKLKSEKGLRLWMEREKAIAQREATQRVNDTEDNPTVFWVNGTGSTEA